EQPATQSAQKQTGRRRGPARPTVPGGLAPGAGDPVAAPTPPVAFAEPVGRRTPVVYTDEAATEADLLKERRRTLRRVPVLVVTMLALAGAAAAGIWYLVPVRNVTDAAITFANFNALKEIDRKQLKDNQRDLLRQDRTRLAARRKLGEI